METSFAARDDVSVWEHVGLITANFRRQSGLCVVFLSTISAKQPPTFHPSAVCFQMTEASLNILIALIAVQFGACALGYRTSFKKGQQHRGQRPSWKMNGNQNQSQAALCSRVS